MKWKRVLFRLNLIVCCDAGWWIEKGVQNLYRIMRATINLRKYISSLAWDINISLAKYFSFTNRSFLDLLSWTKSQEELARAEISVDNCKLCKFQHHITGIWKANLDILNPGFKYFIGYKLKVIWISKWMFWKCDVCQ